MQEFTEGLFFNGKSSEPFRVYVGFSNDQKKIVFESTDIAPTEWLISELTTDLVGSRITMKLLLNSDKVLIVDDSSFAEIFFDNYRKSGKGSFNRFIHAVSLFHIGIVLGVALLISAGYYFFIPWLGEKAVDVMPVYYDEILGKTFFENGINGEKTDSVSSVELNDFAAELNFGTKRKLNFTIVKSTEINAFALPDGNIIVYSGIIKQLTSYTQLAALLSHEVSHVVYRHSMKELCRNLSGYIVLSLITSDANGIMSVLATHVNKLNNLSYSRGFEKEADEKGFYCLQKNGIDPKGMTELFDILKSSESVEIPEFLSTHPLTEARIKNLENLIELANYPVIENEKLKKLFEQIESRKFQIL
jgi:Zn-dependent protease with chaperone function